MALQFEPIDLVFSLDSEMDDEMLGVGELCSEWKSGEGLKPHLEKGDLVEFRRVVQIGRAKRRVYTHWAVSIGKLEGEHYVVHISTEHGDFEGAGETGTLSPSDSIQGISSKIVNGSSAQVRCDLFDRVAQDDLCRVNNVLDRYLRPFPPGIVVDRAQMKLGEGNYNVMFNNCEHFVKWCRYGSKCSEQATLAQSVLLGSGALLLTGSLSAALGTGVAFAAAATVIGEMVGTKMSSYFSFLR